MQSRIDVDIVRLVKDKAAQGCTAKEIVKSLIKQGHDVSIAEVEKILTPIEIKELYIDDDCFSCDFEDGTEQHNDESLIVLDRCLSSCIEELSVEVRNLIKAKHKGTETHYPENAVAILKQLTEIKLKIIGVVGK